MPTDLKECFITLDGYIQQVRAGMSQDEAERTQESLTIGMINVMNALSKTELEDYFNKKPETQEGDHSSEQ